MSEGVFSLERQDEGLIKLMLGIGSYPFLWMVVIEEASTLHHGVHHRSLDMPGFKYWSANVLDSSLRHYAALYD